MKCKYCGSYQLSEIRHGKPGGLYFHCQICSRSFYPEAPAITPKDLNQIIPMHSTEKQNEIIDWLITTSLVDILSNGDYRIQRGRIIELKHRVYVDVYVWLKYERFVDNSTVSGFYFKIEKEPDGSDDNLVEVCYLRKSICVIAPFEASGTWVDNRKHVDLSDMDTRDNDSELAF